MQDELSWSKVFAVRRLVDLFMYTKKKWSTSDRMRTFMCHKASGLCFVCLIFVRLVYGLGLVASLQHPHNPCQDPQDYH